MATSFKKERFFKNRVKCLFCGKPIIIKKGYIYWVTAGARFQLHKECAEELSIGLAFDSVKLKYEQREGKIPYSIKGEKNHE